MFRRMLATALTCVSIVMAADYPAAGGEPAENGSPVLTRGASAKLIVRTADQVAAGALKDVQVLERSKPALL